MPLDAVEEPVETETESEVFAVLGCRWPLEFLGSKELGGHIVRSTDALIMSVVLPIAILLLFVYVFGGAIANGSAYINYVVPGRRRTSA